MNAEIAFNEEEHKYTYIGDNPKYKKKPFVSATTFIGWFKNDFDGDYWSSYKAIKDHYSNISDRRWSQIKYAAGGWENVVQYYLDNQHRASLHTRSDITNRKNAYLEEWALSGKIANEKGTGLHKDLEDDYFHSQQVIGENKKTYSVAKPQPNKENGYLGFYNLQEKEGQSIYPECVIYNLEYMISGMVDRVDRDGIYLDIVDYKTNIKIEKDAFMDQVLFILGIPDAKYYHYQIQMSLYGWMLEKFGYKVRSLTLEHLITESRSSSKVLDTISYPMEYRPDWIEKLVEYRFKKDRIKQDEWKPFIKDKKSYGRN